MTRPAAPACASMALLLGSLAAVAHADADAAPPAPPAPPPAAGSAAVPPPPEGRAERRFERRVVVIDHDGGAEVIAGQGEGDRVLLRVPRDRAGPAGCIAPGGCMMIPGADMMPGKGPRGMGMRGPGGHRGAGAGLMRMARELDLTQEQRMKMRELNEASRPKMEELRSQMRVQRQKLRDADPGAKGYDAAVASAAKRIGELTAQLTQQRAEQRRQAWQLLTPEQRAKAEAKRAEAKKRRDAAADLMERRAREMRGTP